MLSMGSASYAYDGAGNRISQTVSAVVTSYLLDMQPGLVNVLQATQGANTTRYVHAPRGIHAQKDASGNWEWMLQDGLGSVRQAADSSNNVLWNGSYEPYGAPFGTSGASPTIYGFTGEPTDVNALLYLRARYYAPSLGVFTRLDPLATPNRYAYVGGNPINYSDPTGLVVDPNGGGGGLGDGGYGGGGSGEVVAAGDTSAMNGGSVQPEDASNSTAIWVRPGGSVLDAQVASQSYNPVNSIDNFFEYENFWKPGHGLLSFENFQFNTTSQALDILSYGAVNPVSQQGTVSYESDAANLSRILGQINAGCTPDSITKSITDGIQQKGKDCASTLYRIQTRPPYFPDQGSKISHEYFDYDAALQRQIKINPDPNSVAERRIYVNFDNPGEIGRWFRTNRTYPNNYAISVKIDSKFVDVVRIWAYAQGVARGIPQPFRDNLPNRADVKYSFMVGENNEAVYSSFGIPYSWIPAMEMALCPETMQVISRRDFLASLR